MPKIDRPPTPMDRPARHFEGSRYQYAREKLKGFDGVLFDVGCGKESLRDIPGWRGFDREPQQDDVTAWNLDYRCPEEGADAVALLDVLEHTFNPGLAMENISRSMKVGGRLIMTVPNPRWSASRVFALIFGWPSAFQYWDLDYNHHVFTPWQHIVYKLLTDCGFEVEDYVTLDRRTRPFVHRLSAKYPLQCLSDIGRVVIEAADPSSRGMSYGLVARKVREPASTYLAEGH